MRRGLKKNFGGHTPTFRLTIVGKGGGGGGGGGGVAGYSSQAQL